MIFAILAVVALLYVLALLLGMIDAALPSTRSAKPTYTTARVRSLAEQHAADRASDRKRLYGY